MVLHAMPARRELWAVSMGELRAAAVMQRSVMHLGPLFICAPASCGLLGESKLALPPPLRGW